MLTPGPWAYGGHTVARTDEGRVVFVRHADSGERVKARLTDADPGAKFWRADTVEVLEASPHRRDRHPWQAADALLTAAGGLPPVGGAEMGHLTLERQREVKTGVLRELLGGIGRLAPAELDALDPAVEALPGEDPRGLGWRTRAHFAVDAAGSIAMHPHRSEALVPVAGFPLMVPALEALGLAELDFTGAERIDLVAPCGGADGEAPAIVVTPAAGDSAALREALRERLAGELLARLEEASPGLSVLLGPAEGERGPAEVLAGTATVRERAGGSSWEVSAAGFWQIHRHAPATLLEAVGEAAQLTGGQTALDLYSGAGLFTAALAEGVGASGHVLAVEGSPLTSADAARNSAPQEQVEVVRGSVDEVLAERWPGVVRAPRRRAHGSRQRGGGRARRTASRAGSRAASSTRSAAETARPGVVVLDPPRAGAGKNVVDALNALGPSRIVYLSCDPATLARDLARFRHHGWQFESVRGFDLYPNTHHLETLVVLTR